VQGEIIWNRPSESNCVQRQSPENPVLALSHHIPSSTVHLVL
jgi:hypothetical protein